MIHNTYRIDQNQTLVIREPETKDAHRLLRYIDMVSAETDFLTFGPGEYEMSIDDEIKFIETCQHSPNRLVLLAEIDDKIIACLTFRGGDRRRTQHTGEFGISVSQKFWRKGIASILIQNLIKWAKSSGCVKKINLKVRADNTSAIKLYERHHFVREGYVTKELCIADRYYDNILMGRIIE